jgi:hypothetical protein
MTSGSFAEPVIKLFSLDLPVFGPTILGFAGNYTSILAVLDWIRKGSVVKDGKSLGKKAEVQVVLLTSRNLIAYLELTEGLFLPIPGDSSAIGTGGSAAYACHLCGIPAEQAVAAACQVDVNSALPLMIGRFRGNKAVIRQSTPPNP